MMQPMGGAPQMAPQQQYLSQQQQQPPQQWMAPPQQTQQYQVPPPQQQQQPSAAYYYQQHAQQQYSAVAGADSQQSDGVRNLWVGDLLHWMDEQYLLSCFAHTGEVLSAKVIRNKLNGQPEGYGFLEFNSHAAAERTLQTYNGSLMPNSDQNFRLNWASMGAGEKRADDSSDYSVFVGDLAGDVTDFILQETFRAVYPSVKGAKVVTDRLTGRTKGYGFVKFADESEQQRAMIEMNGRFCSTRPMRVGPASKKSSMEGGGQPRGASYQGTQGTSEDDPTNTTLFVGNLDTSVAEEHLRHVFGQYGQLMHVKIPVGKRCGFVQFADRSSAEEALRVLNGTVLGGQNVRLSWGHSPSNKQPQADQSQWNNGGGGGYYGYGTAAGGGGGGGYDGYGYGGQGAAAAQDPSMYYQGYPGYGNYAAQTQQQPPQ